MRRPIPAAAAAPNVWIAAVCVVVSGAFLGITNTLMTQVVMESAPVPQPIASSAYSFVRFCGGAIAPFVAGKLGEHVSVQAPFYLGAGMTAIGIGVLWMYRDALRPAAATVTTLAPFASQAQIKAFIDCPSGQGCVWQNINGGGARLNLPWSTYYGHCWNFTGSWNNAISSAQVTYGSGYGIRFSNDNCGFIGLTFDLNANKRVNFTDWWGWNDAVSSFVIQYLP